LLTAAFEDLKRAQPDRAESLNDSAAANGGMDRKKMVADRTKPPDTGERRFNRDPRGVAVRPDEILTLSNFVVN
jgi:hypothetical protein